MRRQDKTRSNTGQIPWPRAGWPGSPLGPGLTSKTGLGFEWQQRLRLTGSWVRRPAGARGLRTAPGAPLDGSERVPRGLQTAPRAFQEAPRGLQEASRQPQERSKGFPDATKSTSRGSRTLPEVSRPLREHCKRPYRWEQIRNHKKS